jgi:hypothetical protein
MDVFSYKVVGMKRGSKGGKEEGCILVGQQEKGGKVVVGTHLEKGSHKGFK